MKKFFAAFGYLSMLCSEMVIYMVLSIYLGRYLNDNHPISWSWINLTLPLSLLLCLFALYRFFVWLIKKEEKKA